MKWILTVALLQLAIVFGLVCLDTFPLNYDGIRLGYFQQDPVCCDIPLEEIARIESHTFAWYFIMMAYALRVLAAVWLTPRRLGELLAFFILLGIAQFFLTRPIHNFFIPLTIEIAVWALLGICITLDRRYARIPDWKAIPHQDTPTTS
jgi:hypothetical protein